MDAEQFRKLFMPFHEKLYRIAFALLGNSNDAEDMLQDAYYKLWCKRGELTALDNPESFAVTVLKVKIIITNITKITRNLDNTASITKTISELAVFYAYFGRCYGLCIDSGAKRRRIAI